MRTAFITLAILFGMIQTAVSAPLLQVTPAHSKYGLNDHIYFLEDPSRSLSLKDIQQKPYQTLFKPLSELPLQRVSRSFYWLKLSLDFSNTPQQQWLLQFDYCPIEILKLFTPKSDGTYELRKTGNHIPVSQRPVLDRNFIFPIESNRSLQEIYLKIETKGPIIINTTLFTPEAKRVDQRFENRMIGVIYGILIAMIVYNLFIFISIKDKRYFYYVLYISTATAALASHDGTMQELLAPYTIWWSHNAIYFTVCSAVFFGSLFVRNFLSLASCAPRVNQCLLALQATCIVFLPLGFVFDNYNMTYMATFVTMAFSVLALPAGIISIRRNVRSGRYFLLAWSALIFGIFLAGLRYIGIVPDLPFTNYFVHIGATIEVSLLSFALADRINQITSEKEMLQTKANLQLLSANEQLAKSMRLKNHFLTAVSHELRTPMNGIIGATDLLSESHTEEEKSQYVNDIYRSSRQMMSLVENILDFTEAEGGAFKPFNKDFTLDELLDPIIVQFKGKAHRKGISFNVEKPSGGKEYEEVLYHNDPKIIQKILIQILMNAVKFTNTGKITLSVSITPHKERHLASVIILKVQDTGIGMDEETLNKIFSAFQQAEGSYRRKYEGLGIGLSLARSLANKLDGNLFAESTPGEGSTFTLQLPLTKTGKKRTNKSKQAKPPATKNLSQQSAIDTQILIVEDNPVNLKVLNKMVQKLGYATITAENGQEAVDLLANFKVNLILMDCQMPVMDGFEATRTIRQMENGNHTVPIVAVTANTMSEDEALCYEAGMNGFIPKPINQKLVNMALERWLHRG